MPPSPTRLPSSSFVSFLFFFRRALLLLFGTLVLSDCFVAVKMFLAGNRVPHIPIFTAANRCHQNDRWTNRWDTRRPEVGVAGRPVNQPDVIPPSIKETQTVLLLLICKNAQLSSALIQFNPIKSVFDRTPTLTRIRITRLKPLL